MTAADLRLFDHEPAERAEAPPHRAPGLVVRVLPDVPAIDKTFDYLVPDPLRDQVRVGTQVRVELSGRRVGGWVTAVGVDPVPGHELRPIAKVRGWGPPPEVLDLAGWAAWRWAGRPASLLGTASSDHAVPGLPAVGPASGPPGAAPAPGVTVSVVPPAADRWSAIAAAVAAPGPGLVLVPSIAGARRLGARLARSGHDVAVLPDDWARARAGARIVVGARAGAWAPIARLSWAVVLDEHDEVYKEERTPAWHARDVVLERAARDGAPCLLLSPCPSLEALAAADRVVPASRTAARAGWPVVDVVDMRGEDPLRGGLVSQSLARLVQDGARAICVLNRRGRARRLVCAACDTLARCERCGAAVGLDGEAAALACEHCGSTRPVVCERCGATRLKQLRVGVSRLRDDLALLAPGAVVEVTGADAAPGDDLAAAQVHVGTEAVLHRVRHEVDVVAFLDLDLELAAPRYRASEQAFALVVRGARRLGPRARGGRLLLQTRLPDHEVVQGAVHADPERVADAERARRAVLGYPPFAALAAVSGPAAPAFVEALGAPAGLEVLGPADGTWLVRAPDHATLCAALAATPRPSGRVRVEVDPLRV